MIVYTSKGKLFILSWNGEINFSLNFGFLFCNVNVMKTSLHIILFLQKNRYITITCNVNILGSHYLTHYFKNCNELHHITRTRAWLWLIENKFVCGRSLATIQVWVQLIHLKKTLLHCTCAHFSYNYSEKCRTEGLFYKVAYYCHRLFIRCSCIFRTVIIFSILWRTETSITNRISLFPEWQRHR